MVRTHSPLWIAPEVLRGERFGEPCDVYSFAIVMWEILNWREPYPGVHSQRVMQNVAQGTLRPEKTDAVPSHIWKLLGAMWNQVRMKQKVIQYLYFL